MRNCYAGATIYFVALKCYMVVDLSNDLAFINLTSIVNGVCLFLCLSLAYKTHHEIAYTVQNIISLSLPDGGRATECLPR